MTWNQIIITLSVILSALTPVIVMFYANKHEKKSSDVAARVEAVRATLIHSSEKTNIKLVNIQKALTLERIERLRVVDILQQEILDQIAKAKTASDD